MYIVYYTTRHTDTRHLMETNHTPFIWRTQKKWNTTKWMRPVHFKFKKSAKWNAIIPHCSSCGIGFSHLEMNFAKIILINNLRFKCVPCCKCSPFNQIESIVNWNVNELVSTMKAISMELNKNRTICLTKACTMLTTDCAIKWINEKWQANPFIIAQMPYALLI